MPPPFRATDDTVARRLLRKRGWGEQAGAISAAVTTVGPTTFNYFNEGNEAD